jgi:hypothetical protein
VLNIEKSIRDPYTFKSSRICFACLLRGASALAAANAKSEHSAKPSVYGTAVFT